jgi:murein DD-endopeptidase MepM/ murein hydrolase activator NlpD
VLTFLRLKGRILGTSLLGVASSLGGLSIQPAQACRPPVVNQFQRYQLRPGDSIDALARRHNISPATLMGVNPSLRGGGVPVGSQIFIPPIDGVLVRVNPGVTLPDLARTYGIRPDVLFEVNGCQSRPSVVFVPGVRWSAQGTLKPIPNPNPTPIVVTGRYRHPLATPGAVLTRFGSPPAIDPANPNPATQEFHPGVDIAAPTQAQVFAVAAGTVAFAGANPKGSGDSLIVINHAAGVQTRYSQITQPTVKTGQQVTSGTLLGVVAPDSSQRPSHLHFEVRLNSPQGWVAQDPALYIPSLRN